MIVLSPIEKYKEKEELYIAVRDAEERVVSDDLLRTLPDPPTSYKHYKEWLVRSESFERLTSYLKKKFGARKLNILDIGCGNGWAAYKLYLAGHSVTGIDLNTTELEQAERVFGNGDRLKWVFADILDINSLGSNYDVILFNASCQYFPDITALTEKIKPLLSSKGEIHLLDSFFYKENQIQDAKNRTLAYYSKLGFQQMAEYYYHHAITELIKNGYRKKYPILSFGSAGKPQWWLYED